MEDNQEDRKLILKKPSLTLGKSLDQGQVRQSMSHGRHRMVQVEVKRSKRTLLRDKDDVLSTTNPSSETEQDDLQKGGINASLDPRDIEQSKLGESIAQNNPANNDAIAGDLSQSEYETRLQALQNAAQNNTLEKNNLSQREQQALREQEQHKLNTQTENRLRSLKNLEKRNQNTTPSTSEQNSSSKAQESKLDSGAKTTDVADDSQTTDHAKKDVTQQQVGEPVASAKKSTEQPAALKNSRNTRDEELRKELARAKPSGLRARDNERRTGRLSIARALEEEEGITRMRSLAALRRARVKDKKKNTQDSDNDKISRIVTVPETISVSDLANRMAERAGKVIKILMNLGVIVTQNQMIDADTAELVVTEMGHRIHRVAESDVETILYELEEENEDRKITRSPVVTIMGHIDHGKTSLLDKFRKSDVVGGEAGGITQHIGAYNVTLPLGRNVTFIDTPGHEAFSAMRSNGAQATDIIVLVVAADDGVQPQTIEAISHAKAADVPMIIAINKMDRPGADANKIKTSLMQHDVLVESMGGEILDVEISVLKNQNLDKLEDAIFLQAELLELKADPDIAACGVVIESKVEKGKGTVVTVLVQKGSLKRGDILVAGDEWGRVRTMSDAHNVQIKIASPSMPVALVGLQGVPEAGQIFSVLKDEQKAREISEYRQRKRQNTRIARIQPGTLEQMFQKIRTGDSQQLAIILKADTLGSLEAIKASLTKLATDEVSVHILHEGVGGINESDVRLAGASLGLILGFNVRANAQARDQARTQAVDLRYYAIIYELIDDVTSMLSAMLVPEESENRIGYAQIRQVFDISKTGRVAGCLITEGVVRRGAGVRILRNDTVIYEGRLKQLKRFKNDAQEVQNGSECGMAFENFDDLSEHDQIECFEIVQKKRSL